MNKTLTTGFAGALCALASLAGAQAFDLTLTSDSSATIQSDATLTTVGILIGDYDPETNPDGTQTRPGFFGGSGNNPIDTSVTMTTETGGTTQPIGSMLLTLDVDAASANITGLWIDLLNEATLPADLSATLLFDTFHTVNPSMLYPGGIEFPIPLGQLGALQLAAMSQTGDAPGILAATDDPAVFDITAAVPVELMLEIAITPIGGDATTTPVGPLPAILPLVGQVQLNGDNSVTLTVAFGPLENSTEQVIGPIDLPELPLELPTLGAETAGVILALSADTLTVNTLLDIAIVAEGSTTTCNADWNADGTLDFFDVAAFLNDFSSEDPAADLNNDGLFDFFDIQMFLGLFAAGCN
jgi:hypothetical protein